MWMKKINIENPIVWKIAHVILMWERLNFNVENQFKIFTYVCKNPNKI